MNTGFIVDLFYHGGVSMNDYIVLGGDLSEGALEIEHKMRASSKLVKGDCGDCPYLRLYHYPVCYCLFSFVDGSTLCPFDYDLPRARRVYSQNIDTIEFWDNFTKSIIWGVSDDITP